LLKELGRPVKLEYLGVFKYSADGPTYKIPDLDLNVGIIPVYEQDYSRRRAAIIEELVFTEGSYLNDMKLFQTMLLSDAFKKKYKLLLCSNLGNIIKLHDDMFEELLQTDNIAKVFLSRGEALKMYVNYGENYVENQMRMRKLQKSGNSKSRIILEEFNQFACRPVSRLPRYRLIFDKLQEWTEPYHPSKPDLDNLCKLILSINELTTGAVKKWQMKMRATELASEIGRKRLRKAGISSLLEPARSLLREGLVLCPQRVKNPKHLVEVNCLLFNDVLILFHHPRRQLESIFLDGARMSLDARVVLGISVIALTITKPPSERLVFFLLAGPNVRKWEYLIEKQIPLSIE